METIIFLIGVTAIMVLLTLVAFVLGWLFTEVIKHPLHFKPFNCRPCFSFWLTVVLYSVYAWIIAPYFISNGLVVDRFTLIYGITGVGVLSGLVTFLYIKSKFTIYE